MKLISWNVNGLRACVTKGFLDFFKEADADIFCIQETKLQEGQIDLDLPGYYQYWNYAEKKGYSAAAGFLIGLVLPVIGLIYEAGRAVSEAKQTERDMRLAQMIADKMCKREEGTIEK